jgi:hypothetical protein
MRAYSRVVFDTATNEERKRAQIWIDDRNRVVLDRGGVAGRRPATPSELEIARDARAAQGKPRPYVSPPPTNHHREIPGDGVARGA